MTMFEKEGIADIYHKLHPYSITLANPRTTPVKMDPSAVDIMTRDSNIWRQLTSSMKGALLAKITASPKWNEWRVSSADDYKPNSRDGMMPELPSIQKDRTEVLRFVFPKTNRTFSDFSSGRARTEEAMDTSSHVTKIIEEYCTYQDSDEIIGEMQFCYATGMILGNLACQEHWAHIVKVLNAASYFFFHVLTLSQVLFKAYKLAVDLPLFFRKVIEGVHVQFMFDHESSGQRILDCDINLEEHLKLLFTTFKSRLNEGLMELGSNITPDQLAVGKAFEALEAWLCKWDWDLRGNYVRTGQMQTEDGDLVSHYNKRTMKVTTG
jgi:A1 cistron-splicing factor AAR2